MVGQEPKVGINCAHVCVRAPLRLAFEVDCNIVDFQPHDPTPQTLYLPSCSVISSLTALGPQTSSYPEIGPPLPYLMYCLLHSYDACALASRPRNRSEFIQEEHPEVFQKLSHVRFPGQGQRSTSVTCATGLISAWQMQGNSETRQEVSFFSSGLDHRAEGAPLRSAEGAPLSGRRRRPPRR